MSDYAIEKGVPIPPRNPSRKGATKYPFEKMEVGDSFFVPLMREFSAASRWCKDHPDWKLLVRKVEGGYRVWCMARPVTVEQEAPPALPKGPRLRDLTPRKIELLDRAARRG